MHLHAEFQLPPSGIHIQSFAVPRSHLPSNARAPVSSHRIRLLHTEPSREASCAFSAGVQRVPACLPHLLLHPRTRTRASRSLSSRLHRPRRVRTCREPGVHVHVHVHVNASMGDGSTARPGPDRRVRGCTHKNGLSAPRTRPLLARSNDVRAWPSFGLHSRRALKPLSWSAVDCAQSHRHRLQALRLAALSRLRG